MFFTSVGLPGVWQGGWAKTCTFLIASPMPSLRSQCVTRSTWMSQISDYLFRQIPNSHIFVLPYSGVCAPLTAKVACYRCSACSPCSRICSKNVEQPDVTISWTFGRMLVLMLASPGTSYPSGLSSVITWTAMRTARRPIAPTWADWHVQHCRRTTAHIAPSCLRVQPYAVSWTRRD